MSLPVIGVPTQNLQSLGGVPADIPASWVMSQRYIRALTARGALPWMIPLVSDDPDTIRAIYAELDTRITSTKDQMAAQLKQSGRPYKVLVYPGVNHAFHNDTGARYDATQAESAWVATVEWFRQYVR